MSQSVKQRIPLRFYCITSAENKDLKQIEIVSKSYLDESDTPELYFCILRGFWTRTKIFSGDVLQILNPLVDETTSSDSRNPKYKQTLIVNNERGLLVLNPDRLFTATSLMGASFCMRKMWLQTMFNIYGQTSLPLVLGSAVHEVFQAGLRLKLYSVDEIKNLFNTDILKNFTLELYSLGMSVPDFQNVVEPYFQTISKWLQLYMGSLNTNDSGEPKHFEVKRLNDIENEVWSIKYGVIGKMDITLEAQFEEGPSYEDYTKVGAKSKSTIAKRLIPIELKTGRHTFSPGHMGQVILYSYIIQEQYNQDEPNDGYLIYLKDNIKTQVVKSNYNVFRDIIIMRNEFQVFHNKMIDLTSKIDNIKMRIPQQIKTLRFCEGCEYLTECSLIYNCFESKNETYSSDNVFEKAISHLSTSDIEFFRKNITLLELEKQYAAHRDQSDKFWNSSSEDCESRGLGLSKLDIHSQSGHTFKLARSKKCKFTPKLFGLYDINRKLEINYSTLIGKRVMISEELLVSKVCFAIFGCYCKQTSCAIGIVEAFNDDFTVIEITLEKEIITELNDRLVYRMDIINSTSQRPMHTNFANIARLMSSNDERCRELRDMVIRGQFPTNNVNTSVLASLQTIYNSNILNDLNPNQKRAVIGVLRTRCSLIFGCPGSGKTQTIVSLVRVLHSLGHSVLITSFTHVAVDNILVKLIKSNEANNENVDFLRIGAISRIDEPVKKYSEYEKTKEFIEKGDVSSLTTFYKNISIVACTALGVAGHTIFEKRIFDYCILDEASQVVLATCLGPLFMAKNFVLVGDQKQLPPVIQNVNAKKEGLEQSLFSRFLAFVNEDQDQSLQKDESIIDDVIIKQERSPQKRRLLATKNSIRVFPLFIQYRMNRVIMDLANQITYSGKLACGNEQVEFGTLKDFLPPNRPTPLLLANYLDRVLSPTLEDSFIFLDCDKILCANETQIGNDSDKENLQNDDKNMFGAKKKSQYGYVYNDFEAKLIVRLVHEILSVYSAGGLTPSHIGVVSPFRKQVLRIRELFGDELVGEKSLEINTVDQYQGRDKEIIIYSCVKSFVQEGDEVQSATKSNQIDNENSQDSFVSQASSASAGSSIFRSIIDSELLKDERRLNVAITRAKKKLIIVGNRQTLIRYDPFKELFKVMKNDMFIPLCEDIRDEKCLL